MCDVFGVEAAGLLPGDTEAEHWGSTHAALDWTGHLP